MWNKMSPQNTDLSRNLEEMEDDDSDPDDDGDGDVTFILAIVVTVLAVLVMIYFLRFLYRKLCKKQASPPAQTVSTLAYPGRNMYPEHPARLTQYNLFRPGYQPHDHMLGDYHYVAAQQTLRSVRRDRDPDRQMLQGTGFGGHTNQIGELSDYDSGLPLSIRGLGSEYVPRSPSHNSSGSASLDVPSQHLFIQYEASVRELFILTERNVRKKVSNKLLVMVAHLVDHRGDHLILDNMGIALHVPPGAIKEGEKHVISLVLDWDLSDNPDIAPHQSLVSPVVYCGPHGLKLNKPCVLSYKHCAYDAGDIQILVSETEFTHEKQWNPLCDAREDLGRCVVTQEECQVKLDHFSLLTSVQSRSPSSPGKKWIQIAVFTCPLQADLDHYQVRIYLLNKTPCALEWAIQNESQFGGRKCCPEKVFLFSGSGEDMFLSLAYLSDRWTSIDGSEAQRVPFINVWHGQCPHVAMCFKRDSDSRVRNDEINIHFLAYQDGHDNEHERLVVHMTEDPTRRQERQSCCNNPRHGLRSVRITLPEPHPLTTTSSTVEITRGSPTEGAVDVSFANSTHHVDLDRMGDSLSGREIFPEELKRQLMILMDPPAPLGNDWRALASKLSLDQVINFLESIKTSPTLVLLQHMEQKGACLERLFKILEDIGRLDASQHVMRLLRRRGEEHLDSTIPKQTDSQSGT